MSVPRTCGFSPIFLCNTVVTIYQIPNVRWKWNCTWRFKSAQLKDKWIQPKAIILIYSHLTMVFYFMILCSGLECAWNLLMLLQHGREHGVRSSQHPHFSKAMCCQDWMKIIIVWTMINVTKLLIYCTEFYIFIVCNNSNKI